MADRVLVAEDVRLRRGGVDVLRGASVRVGPGEVVALAGRSGSGKSSLCHLVAGVGRPDSGRVLVGGTPADAVDDWAVVALLPQRLALVPELTVAENVQLPRRLRPGRETDDSAELLPGLGLVPLAGRLATQTSLGEQQRTALARAAVVRPRLLVAAEPVAHQNRAWAEAMMALLFEITGSGTACLLATHDEVTVGVAHRVLELHAGRLREISAAPHT